MPQEAMIVALWAIGPIIGSGIGILRRPTTAYIHHMLYFAAGIMLAISFLDLIPESIQIFTQVDRPRGIYLCGNPDRDFLLNLDLYVLSLDVYTNAEIFAPYAASVRKCFDRGGDGLGYCPHGFRDVCTGGNPLLGTTPRKYLHDQITGIEAEAI